MIKKSILSTAIFAALILPVYPADAGMFDWLSKTPNGYLGSPESLGRVYENYIGFSLTKEEIKQDEEVEKSIVEKTVKLEPKRVMIVLATAYSSTPDQTDNTPFITAWNTYVRDGIIAANFLPFGTQIRIPDIFGDKIFIVEDRMHQRYWYRVDVWFPERQTAKEFGVKKVKIEIIS